MKSYCSGVTREAAIVLIIFTFTFIVESSTTREEEAQALRNAGWWGNTVGNHCEWNGIICNKEGRVTKIQNQYPRYINCSGNFEKLNLSNVPYLEHLVLRDCRLEGRIPNLERLALTTLDLSHNRLTALGYIYFCWPTAEVVTNSAKKAIKNGNMCSIWNFDGEIAYQDIIEATNDFDIQYCIGTGGYGSVYRTQLPCGQIFALKKLHHLESEDPAFDKSFKNEIQMLTNIRHKNIVKLYGYCLHQRCMFLVYQYLERGSLFGALRFNDEASTIGWNCRAKIITGVAHALSYMHHDCSPPIVHRDISSSNILLNSEMEACVSDFGTARLLYPDTSNQTVLKGTYGYIAPGKLDCL